MSYIPTSLQNRKSVSTVDDSAKEYVADKYFMSGTSQQSVIVKPVIQQNVVMKPVIQQPQLNSLYNYLLNKRSLQANPTQLKVNPTPTVSMVENIGAHSYIILSVLALISLFAGALIGIYTLPYCCPDLVQDLKNSLDGIDVGLNN